MECLNCIERVLVKAIEAAKHLSWKWKAVVCFLFVYAPCGIKSFACENSQRGMGSSAQVAEAGRVEFVLWTKGRMSLSDWRA